MRFGVKIIGGMLTALSLGMFLVSCADDQPVQSTERSQFEVQANWEMDASASALSFASSYDGDAFTGSFSDFTTQIQFDPDDLAHSQVVVTIDLSSVDAGDAERTDALPDKDWFFVKSFPEAVFESHAFTHLGDNKYEAKGDLTLRGVTKPLVLPFTLSIANGVAQMDGTVQLNRRDFDVGRGMWESDEYVAHTVEVNITVLARKIAP